MPPRPTGLVGNKNNNIDRPGTVFEVLLVFTSLPSSRKQSCIEVRLRIPSLVSHDATYLRNILRQAHERSDRLNGNGAWAEQSERISQKMLRIIPPHNIEVLSNS